MNRHAGIIKLGLQTNPIHASKLIAEYASSRTTDSLRHAHRVFNQVPPDLRDTALWASLISAYSRSPQPRAALHLFSRFDNHAPPNAFVFSAVARAVAAATEHISFGRTVHGTVIKRGFTPRNVVVGTAFVDMYAKCEVLVDAARLFDEMSERNLVTWNAMVSGYIRNGKEINGLELFKEMRCFEFCAKPDQFTLATVISGCAGLQDLVLGIQLHGFSIVSGLESSCIDTIATMYFQSGDVLCGERILAGRGRGRGLGDDSVENLIKIRGYVFNRRYKDALSCVSCSANGILILYRDHTAIVPLLAACAKVPLLKVGKQLHGVFITSLQACFGTAMSEDGGAIVGCSLIDLYSKCGCVVEARKVFDLVAPRLDSHWNSMISCYVNNCMLEDGRDLFERMPEKNVVSWTTMMTGYVRNGKPGEGLSLLARMYGSNEGNSLTYVVGLEACGDLSNLEMGKQLHAKIVRRLLNADTNNVVIGTSLVDMYCKSGQLKYAKRVFDLMEDRNVVAWTSIIMGYAVHGFGFHSLKLFQDLIETGIEPNEVTFVAVLTACSHCGLVDEGLEYLKMMKNYGLVPNEDHQTCLIDILGRSGRLEDAFSLLEETDEMELFAAWGALLGACNLHGNLELGEKVANKMLMERNQMSTTHITLSNVYASAGLWNEAYRVRESWRKGSLKGDPGISGLTMHLSNP